jgi:Uncharacterized protein conserved in bacteria (DUF2188)
MGKSQHVIPSNGQWAVRGAGNRRDTAVFRTQGDAVRLARELARRQHGELVIHGRDGRIREKSSYAADAPPIH